MIERPDIVEDDHLSFFDDLRESGVTNMYGAPTYLYLLRKFDITIKESVIIWKYWKDTFEERHGG